MRPARTRKSRPGITIVGGGLEGVEALGEILRPDRHCEGFGITVVESGQEIRMVFFERTRPLVGCAERAPQAAGAIRDFEAHGGVPREPAAVAPDHPNG